MKKMIFRKAFWCDCLAILCLSAMLFGAVIAVVNGIYGIFILGVFILPIFIVVLIFETMLNNLIILKIDENGINVKNAFIRIQKFSWSEIKDIYVYQFDGTERIKVPYKVDKKGGYKYRRYGRYNLGGTIVFVPRKIPQKWIFIDDSRGDNGENIFEYLKPLKKDAIIRLVYNESVLLVIKKYYKKEVVEKVIEV